MSIAAMKHRDLEKQVGEGTIYLAYLTHHSSSKEVRTGAQAGRNLEAEADAGAMEGCCLLAYSP